MPVILIPERQDDDLSQIYLVKLGRAVRVTAIATSTDEANEYMSRTRGAACIASKGSLVFIAEYNDKGVRFRP